MSSHRFRVFVPLWLRLTSLHPVPGLYKQLVGFTIGGKHKGVLNAVEADSTFVDMEQELKLRIVLESPPPGIDFGLQRGGGNNYETIQTQRSSAGDLSFEFSIRVRDGKEGQPNFLGPFVQGPPQERFIYIDIGTYAGQQNTHWSRRLKVPLRTISWELISKGMTLETRIAGTGKDGGPTCATPKPFNGWHTRK